MVAQALPVPPGPPSPARLAAGLVFMLPPPAQEAQPLTASQVCRTPAGGRGGGVPCPGCPSERVS